MIERNDSRYDETIEQELRPVDCEQRQTDRFKENYNINMRQLYILDFLQYVDKRVVLPNFYMCCLSGGSRCFLPYAIHMCC